MDEDGCGSSGVWNIHSDISLDDVVISFYYWYYLQVGSCNRAKCCSADMDSSLYQIENLQSYSRPSHMVLQRFMIYVAGVDSELDYMDQELFQGISQESGQFFLEYEVGDILDEF